MAKIILTDEERRNRRIARCKAWRERNPDKIISYNTANAEKRAIQINKWQQENKDRVKHNVREWAKANPDKVKKKKQKWYEAHKDEAKIKAAARTKVWREANTERAKKAVISWMKANPDKVKNHHAIRRARKYNVSAEKFSIKDIFDRDKWICGLCKKKVNKKLKYPHPLSASLDHILPLSLKGSHTRKNVQLAHLLCNEKAHIGGIKQTRLF
jgi:hypothetical protein